MSYSIACKKFKIVNLLLKRSIFNDDIIKVILTHYWNIVDSKRKVLLPWIDKEKLKWYKLSRNTNAINILLDHFEKINWNNLSLNCNAIELLRDNQYKINLINISMNPNIFCDESIPV